MYPGPLPRMPHVASLWIMGCRPESAKRLPSSAAKGPKDLHVQVLPFGFAQGRRCAQDDNSGADCFINASTASFAASGETVLKSTGHCAVFASTSRMGQRVMPP